MRPNLPFFSAASNALLKPGGLLKWKVRLVKVARPSLPLTKAIKIVRLTSPLPEVLRLSSSRPRLRHGRRLAFPSHPSLILNPCTFSFALTLAHLPPNFPNCYSSGESALVFADYLRSYFSASKPEATFSSSAKPRDLVSFIRFFALLSPPLHFLRLPSTLPRPLPLAQTKMPNPW